MPIGVQYSTSQPLCLRPEFCACTCPRFYSCFFPPGEAREDWAIVRALSGALGSALPFDTLAALQEKMYAAVPHLADIDAVAPGGQLPENLSAGEMSDQAFVTPIADFYLTDPIARASKVMAECSLQIAELAEKGATGTDG